MGERACFQLADVIRGVDAKDVFVFCRLRRKEIAAICDIAVLQAFVNQAVLLRGKYVVAKVQVVAVIVD